jgi:hypothetical protein
VLVGQEVTPQKSDKKQSDNNMLTLSVGMSAEYPSLFQFLKDFEKLRRPMQIENLSFAKREIEGESVLILTIDALLPLLGTSQEKQ